MLTTETAPATPAPDNDVNYIKEIDRAYEIAYRIQLCLFSILFAIMITTMLTAFLM